MKSRSLLDTDWIIEYLNGQQAVVERLERVGPEGLAISIISLAELYEGVHYSKDPARSEAALDDFVSGLEVVNLDVQICRLFGELRGRLRKSGRLVGDFDTMIAATCLCRDLTLFTNNRRHFEVFEGLKLESK